jgi:hypothetical protein
MKKAFLLMVVPALLAALAFAQTPAAGGNTDQTNIKGCLGGSDGNYTVVEDNTGRNFKISTSSVDLKPHLGHDVTMIGQRASGSAAEANSFAVTELNMISEHCDAAATAPAATATTPAETVTPPAETAAAPAAAAAAPAAAAPAAAPVIPPAETAAAPAPIATEPVATVITPAETTVTPAPAPAEPAAAISTPATGTAEIASTPAAAAAHAKPASAGRRPSATPAAAAAAPAAAATTTSETVSTPTAAAAPAAAASLDTNNTPAAAASMPAKTAKTGSFSIFIAFGVLVILIGILAPFLRRLRKRKMLERTDAPNLSFTHDAKSDEDKRDPPVIRKAA